MLLDLREIIAVPDGIVSFDYEIDMSDTQYGSIQKINSANAAGDVANRAGVLTLRANVDIDCECVCARCLKEFRLPIHKQITAYLTEGSDDGEYTDYYFLQGDKVDLDEIFITEFLLDAHDRLLCRENCAGICEKCGSDLNENVCNCKKDIDPRLAALEQIEL